MKRTPAELIDAAERFASAQEVMAAKSKEDSEHWHHVALAELLREMASALATDPLILGFASYADNSFELIVRDEKTGTETMLCGTLRSGQLDEVSKILPTCVFVKAKPAA